MDSIGFKTIKICRRHIRESGEQQRRARDPAELIREEPMPQFGFGLLSALLSNRQMDVSRRLKPVRQTSVTRPFVVRNCRIEFCIFLLQEPSIRPRLMLNIQHASGIPLRNNGEATQLFLVCTVLVYNFAIKHGQKAKLFSAPIASNRLGGRAPRELARNTGAGHSLITGCRPC